MKKAVLIIIGVLVVAGVAFAGYKVMNKGKEGSSSGGLLSKVSSLNPNCKYNDPDLCKFINGWKEQKYYSVNTTVTTKDGKKSDSVFKVEGEDKSQIISSQDGKENYNVISIGDTTYTKDYSDGKWLKIVNEPADQSTIADTKSDFDFDTKAEKAEDKTTYKKIGTEPCGSLTCFKYQVINPDNADTTEYIYFDNKEYQLRKMRSEGKDGTISESTFDYSKFSITEPSPIKEESTQSVPTNLRNLNLPQSSGDSTLTPQGSQNLDSGDYSIDTGE